MACRYTTYQSAIDLFSIILTYLFIYILVMVKLYNKYFWSEDYDSKQLTRGRKYSQGKY
ncbi:hypothetical protein SAMN05443428_101210 [Caloramator quimbayensis]|uniref:Uncharacterized protein n=1 Tax=Caloramator quimbayensis TaxID=1147123 RepID=A0A1T4WH82_9CLOT|nr:hypothetical protein SAMN05443428_101210 [Caloramator quimbayensis]